MSRFLTHSVRVETDMATVQSEETVDATAGVPSSPGPPSSLTPAVDAPPPTSGSSPAPPGTSCDEPPKLVPLTTGDEDGKAAVATAPSQRLQVHWSHGRKRRASGDSHEVIVVLFYTL